ncbi:MAG: ABC transporter permease [Chthoniobacteraceae bacterium]|jgi:lipopolysaccharide transport system permease protein
MAVDLSTAIAPPADDATDGTRLIRPRKGLIGVNLAELWRYRELFLFLAWRDILVRYKQTFLGVSWALLQPLLTMLIFTVIFGQLAKFSSNGQPFAVMTLAALLPLQFFNNALTESSNSLVASSNMISKIYFPRLIVPAGAVLSGLIDFLISLALLVALMMWFHVQFRLRLLLLPAFLAAAFLAAFAGGVWLSALNVKYRDVKYVVPFFTRMGMYASPVGYMSVDVLHKFGPRVYFFYSLNPMVGVIDGFRWCVLGAGFEPYWAGFLAGMGAVLLVLGSGVIYFRTTEKRFADVI